MTDARVRAAARRARGGEAEAAARLLQERLRAGEVTTEQAVVAAWAGDAAARLVVGEVPTGVPLVEVAWRRLEQWFGVHAPACLKNLRPGATERQLEAFEKKVGATLPDELRAMWRVHAGQREVWPGLLDVWSLLSLDGAFERWDMLDGLFDEESIDADPPSTHPSAVRWGIWRRGWIPVADCNNDTICVDLVPTPRGTMGQVIVRSNSCNFELVAPSVGEWLAGFAGDLDGGVFITDGRKLFSNDDVGRAQMAAVAEREAREEKRAARAAKSVTKKSTKKQPAKKKR